MQDDFEEQITHAINAVAECKEAFSILASRMPEGRPRRLVQHGASLLGSVLTLLEMAKEEIGS